MTPREIEEKKKKKKRESIGGPIYIESKAFEPTEVAKLQKIREQLVKSVPPELRDSPSFKKTIDSLDLVINKQLVMGKPSTFADVDVLRSLYSDFSSNAKEYVSKKSEIEEGPAPSDIVAKPCVKHPDNAEIIDAVKRSSIGKLEMPSMVDEVDLLANKEKPASKEAFADAENPSGKDEPACEGKSPTVLETIPEASEAEESDEDYELKAAFGAADLEDEILINP